MWPGAGTPDRGSQGREPMSTDAPRGQEAAPATTDAPIAGPIPEFDHKDRPTGYEFYRCTGCGREAMRRRDLEGDRCNCGGERR